MKYLLAAVNAKYIHSNPAVYSLKSYAGEKGIAGIEIAEYTINNSVDEVIQDIYKKSPDWIGFSCYIWNISFIKIIIEDLAKLLPETDIWLGGPEVSFECEDTLSRMDKVKGLIYGEGERTLARLLKAYEKENYESELSGINGLVYRKSDGSISVNPPVTEMDMSSLPFIYNSLEDFDNRIIYYESSRGCPFKCSYCLSSVEKKLRFRDIGLVKKELKYFLDRGVNQVKFIDRTFNADKNRAYEIWSFINENDNGITNFHFEISADLLDERQLELLSSLRPGLVQLEIGIQSTCEKTLKEIRRYVDFAVLAANVKEIISFGNIHCHVDLIAGLPYEDIETFKKSFDDVYALKAEQLQLGFLKVLKGSLMYEKASEYGIVSKTEPPYEVLFTKWLSFDDVLRLKGVEEMVELFYNSGQFELTMQCLERYFQSPFDMFEKMSVLYKKLYVFGSKQSRQSRYEFIIEFAEVYIKKDVRELRTILICDYYLRENARVRPAFAGKDMTDKKEISDMYADSLIQICRDERFKDVSYRNLINNTHIEQADFDVLSFVHKGEYRPGRHYILFDYMRRSPLDFNAEMTIN